MKPICIFLILLFLSTKSSAFNDNYSVQVDHTKKTLHVKVCYEIAPDYLHTNSKSAEKLIQNIKWEQTPVRLRYGTIDLPDGKQGCLSYSVNGLLKRDRLNNSKVDQQHPHDTLLEISDWLWQSDEYNQSYKTTITFHHDTGVNISAPWSLISRNKNKTEYSFYIGFLKCLKSTY